MAELHASGYQSWHYYHSHAELRQVLDMIVSGYFSPEEHNRYEAIFERLTTEGDSFLLLADFMSYIECQDQVAKLYVDKQKWLRSAILNVARMGKFSSDRTISEYARNIWHIDPVSIKGGKPS